MTNALLPLLNIIIHLAFYVFTLIFVVFTVFLGYHWFTYGSSKQTSTATLAVFLIVSAPLFLTMSLALTALPL